jgi:signal recognition particle GTPase
MLTSSQAGPRPAFSEEKARKMEEQHAHSLVHLRGFLSSCKAMPQDGAPVDILGMIPGMQQVTKQLPDGMRELLTTPRRSSIR